MIDEITADNIKSLIKMIPEGTNPLEKVILCNEGTVQTLLSVIFGVPIKVEVIHQHETNTNIIRWSRLVAEFSPDNIIQVCSAQTVITKSECPEGFINGIIEADRGIGQLISSIGLNTKRKLIMVDTNKNTFSRAYVIESMGQNSPMLKVFITETFTKSVYDQIINMK